MAHLDADLVLHGYAADAAELIPRYEAVDSAEKLRPVSHLIPHHPAVMADLGAGTGADAAWLAARGHTVIAVEPTEALRSAGRQLHGGRNVEWLDDRLPDLRCLRARTERFSWILIAGVWTHLDVHQRQHAMGTVASLLKLGGFLVISLRRGPSSVHRPHNEVSPMETVDLASARELHLSAHAKAPSVQDANQSSGVSWHWLAFQKSFRHD